MPRRHGNRANKQFGLSKAASDSFSGIMSMFHGQLSTPARIRLFLQKCLDDPKFAFNLNQSHIDSIATDTDVLPKLQNGSYDDIRFVLHSRCKKVAWYWVHSRFLISQGIYSLLASGGATREMLPQMKILDFNKFIRCTNPQPTPDLEQRILNSILAGSRYDFLCRIEGPSSECLVHEGLLFLLPHFVTAPQWEKEFGTAHLDAIRTHLHYLGVKPIADSYQGESGSLKDLVRRITDHYIKTIESSYGIHDLSNTTVDPTNDLEVRHETAASVQSFMKSLDNPSTTEGIEWEPFESDAHAAEAQLQRELSEAISYEEQVAGDIKGLVQLMELEASEHDAVAADDRDSGSTNDTSTDHEGLVRDGTAIALKLKLAEDEKPIGLKRRYSLTALLDLRDSVWEQTQAKEIIQDDERPSKSQRYLADSASASGHRIEHEDDYNNPSEQQPSWPIRPSSNVQQTHHHQQYITQSSLISADITPLLYPARSPDTLHIHRQYPEPHQPQANGSAVSHLDRPASDPQPKAALPPQRDHYKRSLTSPSAQRRNVRYFDPQPPPAAWETETLFPNHIT
ncbi:MAG: hypothetical protein Q9184_007268 [Pyrenodesmia sp. 2 TL-2023]